FDGGGGDVRTANRLTRRARRGVRSTGSDDKNILRRWTAMELASRRTRGGNIWLRVRTTKTARECVCVAVLPGDAYAVGGALSCGVLVALYAARDLKFCKKRGEPANGDQGYKVRTTPSAVLTLRRTMVENWAHWDWSSLREKTRSVRVVDFLTSRPWKVVPFRRAIFPRRCRGDGRSALGSGPRKGYMNRDATALRRQCPGKAARMAFSQEMTSLTRMNAKKSGESYRFDRRSPRAKLACGGTTFGARALVSPRPRLSDFLSVFLVSVDDVSGETVVSQNDNRRTSQLPAGVPASRAGERQSVRRLPRVPQSSSTIHWAVAANVSQPCIYGRRLRLANHSIPAFRVRSAKFTRHIKRIHKDEPRVAQIIEESGAMTPSEKKKFRRKEYMILSRKDCGLFKEEVRRRKGNRRLPDSYQPTRSSQARDDAGQNTHHDGVAWHSEQKSSEKQDAVLEVASRDDLIVAFAEFVILKVYDYDSDEDEDDEVQEMDEPSTSGLPQHAVIKRKTENKIDVLRSDVRLLARYVMAYWTRHPAESPRHIHRRYIQAYSPGNPKIDKRLQPRGPRQKNDGPN
ncbi:hypothetical protein U1Q18_052244, partial [Sarracenia purpurea var. burkii]